MSKPPHDVDESQTFVVKAGTVIVVNGQLCRVLASVTCERLKYEKAQQK
jgi:hypothetical protein